MKEKEWTPETRRIVWRKHKKGDSYATIAEQLGMSKSSVGGIVRRMKKNGGTSLSAARSGRPKVTSRRTDSVIVRTVMANRRLSADRLKKEVLENYGIKCSASTIRNRLREQDLHGRAARKRPYLKPEHRKKRVEYAKKMLELEPESWDNVLFSDECSVQLHGSEGRVWVWRRAHEAFKDQCVKKVNRSNRKSLMVWGSISRNGVGTLHLCDRNVNAPYYQQILRTNVPLTKDFLGIKDCLWVHDNASPHKARTTQAVLTELGLKNLKHPPCSPDLNPIENIWAIMKSKLAENPCNTIDELKIRLRQIWTEIDDETIRKTVDSMPDRLDMVLAARGGYTRY